MILHLRGLGGKFEVAAGIFPLTGKGGWLGGVGCLPAALMALDDVNERSQLLPGYKLRLMLNDSEVRRLLRC